MTELDLGLLGLEPGKLIWGQLGKAWWPGRVRTHCFISFQYYLYNGRPLGESGA